MLLPLNYLLLRIGRFQIGEDVSAALCDLSARFRVFLVSLSFSFWLSRLTKMTLIEARSRQNGKARWRAKLAATGNGGRIRGLDLFGKHWR